MAEACSICLLNYQSVSAPSESASVRLVSHETLHILAALSYIRFKFVITWRFEGWKRAAVYRVQLINDPLETVDIGRNFTLRASWMREHYVGWSWRGHETKPVILLEMSGYSDLNAKLLNVSMPTRDMLCSKKGVNRGCRSFILPAFGASCCLRSQAEPACFD